jgi:hypothetical protein
VGLTVDSNGRVWPEGQWVDPAGAPSIEIVHDRAINWTWNAEWGDDGGVPVLGMKFKTDHQPLPGESW